MVFVYAKLFAFTLAICVLVSSEPIPQKRDEGSHDVVRAQHGRRAAVGDAAALLRQRQVKVMRRDAPVKRQSLKREPEATPLAKRQSLKREPEATPVAKRQVSARFEPGPTPVGKRQVFARFEPAATPVGKRQVSARFDEPTPVAKRQVSARYEPEATPVGKRQVSARFEPGATPVGKRQVSARFEAPTPLGKRQVSARFEAPTPVVKRQVSARFEPGSTPAGKRQVSARFEAPTPVVKRQVSARFEPGATPVGKRQVSARFEDFTPVAKRQVSARFEGPTPAAKRQVSARFEEPTPVAKRQVSARHPAPEATPDKRQVSMREVATPVRRQAEPLAGGPKRQDMYFASSPRCAGLGQKACPVKSNFGYVVGHGVDFECVDIRNSLDSCGGCVDLAFDGELSEDGGRDCSSIPHVDDVMCVRGGCLIQKCKRGYKVSVDGDSCVIDTAAIRKANEKASFY